MKLASSDADAVIYLMSDQPEACRWCGVRTIFVELKDGLQRHECPRCKAEYFVETDFADAESKVPGSN